MKNSARRFAKALVEVGVEEKACSKYGAELRTTLGVFKGAPELYRVLLNPMYRIEERRAIMEKVSSSLALSPYVAKFLQILVENRNIRILEDIVGAYSALEDDIAGRVRATVESPFDIDEAHLEEIRKKLGEAAGKEVLLAYRKNPALLGGLVVRMGNTILDGSLKTQLELMEQKILEGVV